MAKPPRPPQPMGADESGVEPRPSGALPNARRTIGRLPAEDSVSISAPSPIRRGGKPVPPAAVGMRAAVTPTSPISEKTVEIRGATRSRVQESQQERRRRVWDKLDTARKKADDRRSRLDRFSPKRAAVVDPGEGDDPSGGAGEEPAEQANAEEDEDFTEDAVDQADEDDGADSGGEVG